MLEDTTVNSIDGNLFRSLFHYASWRRQVSFFFFFFAMAIPNAIYPFAFFSLNHTINYLIYRWWAFTLTKFNGYLIPESIQIIVYARNKKEIFVCELKRLPTTTKKEWLIFFFHSKWKGGIWAVKQRVFDSFFSLQISSYLHVETLCRLFCNPIGKKMVPRKICLLNKLDFIC